MLPKPQVLNGFPMLVVTDRWKMFNWRFGWLMQLICNLLLVGLLLYIVIYHNDLTTHPCKQCEKLGLICFYHSIPFTEPNLTLQAQNLTTINISLIN